MAGKGFEDLQVWQKSRELVKVIYRITSRFPKEEQFGLCNQLRRAAISIGSNIAEGSARNSEKDFARFLLIAIGSAAEIRAQLIYAHDLEFIDQTTMDSAIPVVYEISRMLKGLRKSVLSKISTFETT